MNVVILGSGKGSNAEAIMKANIDQKLGSTAIVGVFSDIKDSKVLEHGKKYNIHSQFINPGCKSSKITPYEEEEWIENILLHKPDLIVLAGFMRILQSEFLSAFNNKIINLHPSLLPSFPGLNSIQRAFDKKVKITGCTVHWVTGKIDEGEIIAQVPVRIMNGDTLDLVKQKVHAAEHMLLPWVISDLAQGIISFPK
jgi:phosphoribosylglycinamide formyltransferase-1